MGPTVIGLLSGSTLKRRVLSGGAWAAVGRVGASVLGLLTNFALLHMLTPPEYVVYGLAFTIITVDVVVGSMGLPKTVVQFVAENVALNQTGRVRRAISLVSDAHLALQHRVGELSMAFIGHHEQDRYRYFIHTARGCGAREKIVVTLYPIGKLSPILIARCHH